MSFRGFMSLRRHQVASLEPSREEELHLLDLLHSRLSDSLQSLIPDSKSSFLIISFPFLHKLLDILLACESDFKSLLLLVYSRNPSLVSRPPLDRAIPDLIDRSVKSLDLCNAVSVSLNSLGVWNRHANIASSALQQPGPPFISPQISRAQRALSKFLLSTSTGLSTSSCSRRMCRICSAKSYLQSVASGLTSHRNGESGSTTVLALAVHTISTLLHFTMWVMVESFPCGSGEIHIPPLMLSSMKQMPWTAALTHLHEKIVEEVKKDRKEKSLIAGTGMLYETLALERSGREVLEKVGNGEEIQAAATDLSIASRILDEELGPFERKVREVFHRLVRCREEILRCLGGINISSSSSSSSIDSV